MLIDSSWRLDASDREERDQNQQCKRDWSGEMI
jgi:hypothetical protein